MSTLCAVEFCARPVRQGQAVCEQCAWRLERDLGDLPALWEELQVTLTRQARIGPVNGSRCDDKPADRLTPDRVDRLKDLPVLHQTPLPFSIDASRLSWSVRNTVSTWVRVLHDGAEAWPRDDVPAMARWLLSRRLVILRHEAVAEVCDEIGFCVDEILRIVDRAADRWFVGVCGAVIVPDTVSDAEEGRIQPRTGPGKGNHLRTCTQSLYGALTSATITCRACGAVHSASERSEALRDLLADRLLTGAEIAMMAAHFGEVKNREDARNQIKTWADRKRIHAKGVDLRGHPLYAYGEVVAMLRRADVKAG